MTLKRTQDRKTANLSNRAGKQSVIANAFSLPSGTNFSCPGATSICERVCYAGRLEKAYKGFMAVVLHNWQAMNTGHMLTLLSNMIDDFRRECDKRGAKKLFRIHADGDFFSVAYAQAWRQVIKANPDIHFWVYTRSFVPALNVLPTITGIPNLSVYLSVDDDNVQYAIEQRDLYPEVKWAFLGETNESTKADMLTLFDRPGAICPENVKRIPLITESGGACVNCSLCVFGKSDVRFAIKKR